MLANGHRVNSIPELELIFISQSELIFLGIGIEFFGIGIDFVEIIDLTLLIFTP